MSKTDRHRPTWVQALDKPDRYAIAVHRHEHGPCTLPPLTGTADPFTFRATGCYYTYATEMLSTASTCGCPLCTAKFERRSQRRRDRHDWKRAARTLPLDRLDDVTSTTVRDGHRPLF